MTRPAPVDIPDPLLFEPPASGWSEIERDKLHAAWVATRERNLNTRQTIIAIADEAARILREDR